MGRYWYDSQRPNRLANITLEGYAGAQALTGTRALSYVFDDYGSTARSNGSVHMGNGNLMYTVSHDNARGKHTVRWEIYKIGVGYRWSMRAALNISSCITVLMRRRLAAWRTGASGSFKVFCPIKRNKFIATAANWQIK